ncbi:hypothetical protein HAX54_025609, partial [Datura stramonium]|nr:hypothetical protein [Datura stramonium]
MSGLSDDEECTILLEISGLRLRDVSVSVRSEVRKRIAEEGANTVQKGIAATHLS